LPISASSPRPNGFRIICACPRVISFAISAHQRPA
jgi:hypothetical protein